MTLRYSLVMVGMLALAGASLAMERASSAVEVEEPSDAPAADAKTQVEETAESKPAVETTAQADEEAPEATEKAADAAPIEGDEAAPAVASEAVAPKAAPLAPAQAERLKAFARGPIKFTSIGKVKAFMIKVDRNLEYTMNAVKKDGQLKSVAVTMIDHANGDKVVKGNLDVTKSGALRTKSLPLTNACNVGIVDPTVRKSLLDAEGPVVSKSSMEVSGAVQPITVTHTREGDVAEDGSMKVKSETESADGKIHLTTITELASDGLPMGAETTGTIAKGPINLNVNLKLTREVDGATGTGE